MFVQVIRATAKDPAGIRKQTERWNEEIKPGASGYLGSTMGVTEDGTFIALARFESEEAARANSERPEQGAWWDETAKYLDDPTFIDCKEVIPWRNGGSDSAGFVQIIQGRLSNPQRYAELSQQMDEVMAERRPDVIGGLHSDHGDGGFTEAIYFTSEAEARANEQNPPPPGLEKQMEEWMSLTSDMKYYNLSEPWLFS